MNVLQNTFTRCCATSVFPSRTRRMSVVRASPVARPYRGTCGFVCSYCRVRIAG